MKTADVGLQNEGSVVVFHAHTPAAAQWLRDNAVTEAWNWLGHSSLAVEWRYASDLYHGLTAAGFTFDLGASERAAS